MPMMSSSRFSTGGNDAALQPPLHQSPPAPGALFLPCSSIHMRAGNPAQPSPTQPIPCHLIIIITPRHRQTKGHHLVWRGLPLESPPDSFLSSPAWRSGGIRFANNKQLSLSMFVSVYPRWGVNRRLLQRLRFKPPKLRVRLRGDSDSTLKIIVSTLTTPTNVEVHKKS